MVEQAGELAERVLAFGSANPTRVAVDGFCAAGKTTFADALADRLNASGRPVIRATTDDFQTPPDIRYQDGEQSARGFFLHAIDFEALRANLLVPLGPNGDRRYRTSTYDIHEGRPNLAPVQVADPASILIVDGLFLLSGRLRALWDFSVFIDAPVEICIARARRRNQERFRDADSVEARYRDRYAPGFQLYLDRDHPRKRADAVVRNDGGPP